MDEIRLLVLRDSIATDLHFLDRLRAIVKIEDATEPAAIRAAAPHSRVILSAAFSGGPFQTAWPLARSVEWVHTLSAGVEHLLTPEFVASPVPLTNARGVYKRSLAEFTIAGILYFAKDLPRMLHNQRAGRWEQFEVEEVHGKTFGVVGFGEIGREGAVLARALGMKILAIRRRPSLSDGDAVADAIYPPDKLREMLAQCDYVMVAAAMTPATRGLIGEAELRAMKNTAVIINIGRGPIIDEPALIRALDEHWIRGAALDVFTHEPLPAGHPFYQMENVLLSPHCADRIPGWLDLSVEFFLQNFERFRNGEPLLNIVDKHARY